MILLAKPSEHAVAEFLSAKLGQEFSYPEVGMTNQTTDAPPGYIADHNRVRLGEGEQAFAAACNALREWQHFNLGWVNVCSPQVPPIESGSVVAVRAFCASVWWLFACRIVYVVDEDDGVTRKFGFAYGTLPDHPECGEERFTVEWNGSDNSVWYDILAFSQPAHILARLAYPLTRIIQKKFAQDSMRSMLKATAGAGTR
jgi:uncharacterized protein (UPF0548 family)